jgi:hypothetical protein
MKFLCSLIAMAGVALTVEAAPRITLTAPRAATVLEGGSETVIEWSASSLPAHAEEWEAFLSLDGGKYYAVRITPHLDARLRSFRWRVPNLAASNARILIRVGDERDEEVIAFAQTFRLVAGPASFSHDWTGTLLADGGGEPAIPAAPPTVEWISGDRHGGSQVTHRDRDHCAVERGDRVTSAESGPVTAHVTSPSSLNPPGGESIATTRKPQRRPELRVPGKSRPLLLLVTRLNI